MTVCRSFRFLAKPCQCFFSDFHASEGLLVLPARAYHSNLARPMLMNAKPRSWESGPVAGEWVYPTGGCPQ